jgi:thiamine pyrophosphate-dependent acetolactate synthase large subunit-like protein
MNATVVVGALVRGAPEALFVASLGTATSALRSVTDDGPHLYLGGSMGSALAVAIGVAEKRPDRDVVAVLGDGEALMGAGSFWTLASVRSTRLVVAVLCDGHYSITGGQALGSPANFAAVGRALGLSAATVETEDEIVAALQVNGRPDLLEIQYSEQAWPGPSAFVDPPVVRWRFERAAAGEPAAGS